MDKWKRSIYTWESKQKIIKPNCGQVRVVLGTRKIVDGKGIIYPEIHKRAEPRIVVKHLRAANYQKRYGRTKNIYAVTPEKAASGFSLFYLLLRLPAQLLESGNQESNRRNAINGKRRAA